MASLTKKRIKDVFKDSLENVRKGKRPNVSGIMLKKGYSPSSAKCLKITKTKTWQELLNQIDNQEILGVFHEIMTDRDENGKLKDKDAVIKAGKELATLKDLYPASKSKIIGLFEKIDNISE